MMLVCLLLLAGVMLHLVPDAAACAAVQAVAVRGAGVALYAPPVICTALPSVAVPL